MYLSLPKRFPLFILAPSVCKSLQCLISALTQAGGGSHLVRLTCSVVLWGRRNTASKYHWHVWGVLSVSGPHWVCPHSACVLSRSTLLRLQVALQGNCLKRALGWVHFPGLSCSGSGSRVLHKAQTQLGLCLVPFPGLNSSVDQVLGKRTLRRWAVRLITSPSQSLDFLGVQQESCLRCAMCLLWGADLRLQPSWWMSTLQDPRKCG